MLMLIFLLVATLAFCLALCNALSWRAISAMLADWRLTMADLESEATRLEGLATTLEGLVPAIQTKIATDGQANADLVTRVDAAAGRIDAANTALAAIVSPPGA